mmetsp:Transcript_79308/g.178949  ORF Transcript_79308/g.178949 Transcript_79308/m.178949 type:complete len:202 (-) Transcript_79308:67-672(-)
MLRVLGSAMFAEVGQQGGEPHRPEDVGLNLNGPVVVVHVVAVAQDDAWRHRVRHGQPPRMDLRHRLTPGSRSRVKGDSLPASSGVESGHSAEENVGPGSVAHNPVAVGDPHAGGHVVGRVQSAVRIPQRRLGAVVLLNYLRRCNGSNDDLQGEEDEQEAEAAAASTDSRTLLGLAADAGGAPSLRSTITFETLRLRDLNVL